MSRFLKICLCATALFLSMSFPASALLGVGLQYGIDFSLDMKDATGEKAVFDDLKLNVASISGTKPSGLNLQISGEDIPIKIDRTQWQRGLVNLGGKLYVDIIPFIDCVELSGQFGLWEYDGKIIYPKSMEFKSQQPSNANSPFIDRVNVKYDTTSLTLTELGQQKFLGLSKTPYAKLTIDLSVRKYLLQFPSITKTLRLYAGAGFDVNFATPMLSGNLIKDALGTRLNKAYDVDKLESDLFGKTDVMSDVSKKVFEQMFTPHYGCHIIAGVMVKIPVVPIGVYIDGKFLIPFDKMDKYVDIGGLGVLLNAGIALAF
jgi:hypothetical protein